MIRSHLSAAVVILAIALAAGAALAHSKKAVTLPADGALLQSSPKTISMAFNKLMRVTFIALSDETGDKHHLTRTDNMQPLTEFNAMPADLPVGHYTIEWRGLASDGHPMSGQFSFEIKG